jgi:hypothetical protein
MSTAPTGTTTSMPLGMAVEDLLTTLDSADLFDLTADEVRAAIIETEQVRARLDALSCRLIERFDTAAMAGDDGYATTRAWLRQRCQMSGPMASRRVKTARALRSMPVVRAGVDAGRLSFEQAHAFAAVLNPRTEHAMTIDEERLVAGALGSNVDDLQQELREWKESVDEDGPEPDAGHLSRHVTLAQGLDGQWFGTLEYGGADGALMKSAVDQMAEWLNRQERRDVALDPSLARTAGQRRADALLELVRRGLATLNDTYAPGHTPKPSLSLLITLEDLEGGRSARTDSADRVGGAGLDRLLCDCSVNPIGWSVEGNPLSHGRTKRLPTPEQRRSAIAKYGGCFFPGCDAPAHWADIHHLLHWDRDNGDTDQPNLAPACSGTHHKLFHEGGWDTRLEPDGSITILRPDGTVFDPVPGWN